MLDVRVSVAVAWEGEINGLRGVGEVGVVGGRALRPHRDVD